MDSHPPKREDNSEDSPTYSRLFVVHNKNASEDEMQEAFGKFGEIEDLRMPKDRDSGMSKGISFIKFSKTSEAARALEAMNMKILPNTTRPLKVMVAANRSDIQSDEYDDDKYKRLFINMPRSETEEILEEHFGQFGTIDSIHIQCNRNTGEPNGFAYVKFRRFSQAAKAYEECNKKYRAIFARPKANKRQETMFESNLSNLVATSANMKTSLISMMNTTPKGFTRVNFICSPYLTYNDMQRIFDLIPGLVNFEFHTDWVRGNGRGQASYASPMSASYALEKLNRFEYPPGVQMFCRPDTNFTPNEQKFNSVPNVISNLKNVIDSTANSNTPDLAKLAEAVAEASKLIQVATAGVSGDMIPSSNDLNYCSVKLPPPQPLANIDSEVAKRCFLICKPQPPPQTVLRDIFCRFGDLINVYTLPNKTVGYARYASVKAADEAIKQLHGAEICGIRMKVIEAEEETGSKRMRYDY